MAAFKSSIVWGLFEYLEFFIQQTVFVHPVLCSVDLHRNISVQQDQQEALFTFSLLRLIASTCFQHLFAHHQEALYVQQLVCFVRIMLDGC
jgi:hypothetical protein